MQPEPLIILIEMNSSDRNILTYYKTRNNSDMMVKKIRKDGHILLDKKYAGRKVVIEQIHDGVWLIKTGDFIPDNEKWLHMPDISASLDSAIRWAEKHPPLETDIDALEEKLNA